MGGCLYAIFIRPFELVARILWNLLMLVPYFIALFLLLVFMFNLGWIGFDPLGGFNPFGWFERTTPVSRPAAPTPSVGTPAGDGTLQLVFRFEARGDQIYYLGNSIDEAYFRQLAQQALALDARVEVYTASDVTVGEADQIRAILNDVGVNYQIIPME